MGSKHKLTKFYSWLRTPYLHGHRKIKLQQSLLNRDYSSKFRRFNCLLNTGIMPENYGTFRLSYIHHIKNSAVHCILGSLCSRYVDETDEELDRKKALYPQHCVRIIKPEKVISTVLCVGIGQPEKSDIHRTLCKNWTAKKSYIHRTLRGNWTARKVISTVFCVWIGPPEKLYPPYSVWKLDSQKKSYIHWTLCVGIGQPEKLYPPYYVWELDSQKQLYPPYSVCELDSQKRYIHRTLCVN